MFGIILATRGSPAPCPRPDLDRLNLFSRGETTGPEDREEPTAGSRRGRLTAGEPSPGLRSFDSKSRRSRKAHIERARRLLAADLTYIAHPSFDDPSAGDAILAQCRGSKPPCWIGLRCPATTMRIPPMGPGSRLASRKPTCSAR